MTYPMPKDAKTPNAAGAAEGRMSNSTEALSIRQRLSGLPGGTWAFSRLVCWKAPYFASIRPRFAALRPGYCEVHIKNRRAVLNHMGTVHAIAL